MELETLLNSPAFHQRIGHGTDPSDQSVWRHLFEEVFELPARYHTMGTSNLTHAEWVGAYIYHDIESYRSRFPPPPQTRVARAIARHTTEATSLLGALCRRVEHPGCDAVRNRRESVRESMEEAAISERAAAARYSLRLDAKPDTGHRQRTMMQSKAQHWRQEEVTQQGVARASNATAMRRSV